MYYDVGVHEDSIPAWLEGKQTGDVVTAFLGGVLRDYIVHKLPHGYGLMIRAPEELRNAVTEERSK